jgi:hypothetical protein
MRTSCSGPRAVCGNKAGMERGGLVRDLRKSVRDRFAGTNTRAESTFWERFPRPRQARSSATSYADSSRKGDASPRRNETKERNFFLSQIQPGLARALGKYFFSPSRKGRKGKQSTVDTGKARVIPLALKLRFQAKTTDCLLQGATKPKSVLGVLCAFARSP